MTENEAGTITLPPLDPIEELGRAVEAWRSAATARSEEIVRLRARCWALEVQRTRLNNALDGLAISHDRAVARVAELEAAIPSEPSERERQDAAVGRLASR